MRLVVVAVSPLLEAPAPLPAPRSHPILVKAATEEVVCFPICKEVQNLGKVILKCLKLCIDFLDQYFRIFEFQSSHTSTLCFVSISASINDSPSTSRAAEREKWLRIRLLPYCTCEEAKNILIGALQIQLFRH